MKRNKKKVDGGEDEAELNEEFGQGDGITDIRKE